MEDPWPLVAGQPGDNDPLIDLAGLVDVATAARLVQARAGQDTMRRLRLADLVPGDLGVIEATVVQVHPSRRHSRKRGGEGELGRVTLADASGERDLVLWDDELRHVRGPTAALQPGARVRLRGAQVKAGRDGGPVELGLGSALLEALPAVPTMLVSATLLGLGPTRVLDGPPIAFQADATVGLAGAPGATRSVVLAGELLRATRTALSAGVGCTIEGLVAHPALEGWMLTAPGAKVVVSQAPPAGLLPAI